jgi:nitronate monooxygenase
MDGTLSEAAVYEGRERLCDIGYLRAAYRKDDGSLGYRCPAEEVAQYTGKGGDAADTVGRKCLCNGLLATVGLGQICENYAEPAIVTAGDEVAKVARFVKPPKRSYSAADVVQYLLAPMKDAIRATEPIPANCV